MYWIEDLAGNEIAAYAMIDSAYCAWDIAVAEGFRGYLTTIDKDGHFRTITTTEVDPDDGAADEDWGLE